MLKIRGERFNIQMNRRTFALPFLNPCETHFIDMTKADIVNEIVEKTGIEKADVQQAVEAFMKSIKTSLEKGQNVYLRGFGSFVVKKRAQKTGRNILKNTTIVIPAHNIPSFKPAKVFVDGVKKKVKVK